MRRRGFTLIETIAALTIASIALPTLLWAMTESQAKRVAPIAAGKAHWLATERIEEVISDRASSTRGYAFVANASYPAESSITNFPGFTRTTSVTESGVTLSGAGTGYKTVQVVVSFTDGSGVSRSVTLRTVVTSF